MIRLMIVISTILFSVSINHCLSEHDKPNTALFISVPFIGHLNPMLQQAKELYQRHGNDYRIFIVSCSNVKAYVEEICINTTIHFLDIGFCYNVTEFNALLNKIASLSNSLSTSLLVFRWSTEILYPQMFQQMIDVVRPDIFNESKHVIAIVDLLTYAGCHFADHFDIPLIINNADLLPILGWLGIAPADYNPTMLLDPPQSIHSIGSNLLKRTTFPLMRFLLKIYTSIPNNPWLHTTLQTSFPFIDTLNAFKRFKSRMILVNNVWGLEYAQSLPPYVQLTGPILSNKLSSYDYLKLLSDEDRLWIESDSRPIIYVNFGTCVPLFIEHMRKICKSS